MFDFTHMEQYRENNRLEAKLATGGLPESLWETYSSFANSYGGIILLGVEELPDRSLRIQGLLDAHEMLDRFLTMIQDPGIVSLNLISGRQARVEKTDSGEIIIIEIPWVGTHVRPVYIGSDPYYGTYRRDGDADIRCSRDEVDAMLEQHIPSTSSK